MADTKKSFVLQKVQPALLGLMDGAVSTLAPIFAAAGLSGKAQSAFLQANNSRSAACAYSRDVPRNYSQGSATVSRNPPWLECLLLVIGGDNGKSARCLLTFESGHGRQA